MTKLHELLAAEKTPTGAWNQLYEDTLKKFKNSSHFFEGHSKSLSMIEDSPSNKAIEEQAREEKPVTTNVRETLEYALDIFARAEDMQYQKNKTNQKAVGTIMWEGKPLIENLPVDQLLGLEARLSRLRLLVGEVPTLDATKHWERAPTEGGWKTIHPEENTKTEKQVIPVTLKEATKEHPAQVTTINKDVVVGKFTTIKRSGCATAVEKSDAIRRIDDLLIEVKQARMRANETEAETGKIAHKIVDLILQPFKS